MDWRQTINGIDLLIGVLAFFAGYGFRLWVAAWQALPGNQITDEQDLSWPCDRCMAQPCVCLTWRCDRCQLAAIFPAKDAGGAGMTADDDGPRIYWKKPVICDCGGTMANPTIRPWPRSPGGFYRRKKPAGPPA